MRLLPFAALVFASLVSLSAGADDLDAGARDPDAALRCDKDIARKARELAEKGMKIAAGSLQTKRSLETMRSVPWMVRKAVEVTRCVEPGLTDAELREARNFEARGAKWADEEDSRLAAEQKLRDEVVLPMCEASWIIEQAHAAIARERSNPGGVANLRVLHDAGEDIQRSRAVLAQLSPRYSAARKHAYTDWKTEGVCLSQVEANQ